MADTRALLDRIAAFRLKIESTPALAPPKTHEALQPAVAEGPKLTARAHRLLLSARDLIARQKQLGNEPIVNIADDPLANYHRSTVSLTETALRLAGQLPANVDAQLIACDGLEQLLKMIEQRNDSLQEAIAVRGVDQRRIERLASLLEALRCGRAITLTPLVDLANEILDDSRQGLRLRLLCPMEAAGPDRSSVRFIAAHSLNAAAIVARLLPHDFEWAAKPVLPLLAALVMDVGLGGASFEALFGTQDLTIEEQRQVEAHSRNGAETVRRLLPDSGPLAEIVLAHHERPDGTGYPNGAIGELIPPLARFLSVADAYARLVTARPGREPLDTRSALTEVLMLAEQGRLDRDFAEYLMNLSFHPVGTVVELVDGRVAVVAATHGRRSDARASGRPVVAILTEADGRVRSRPEILDLAAADRGGILRSIPKGECRGKLSEWYPELCV